MTRTQTFIGRTAAALALTAALAAPAAAATTSSTTLLCRWFPALCGTKPPATPEIDPSLARGTLTLLIGGVLMLAERRRR